MQWSVLPRRRHSICKSRLVQPIGLARDWVRGREGESSGNMHTTEPV